ncbi:MAG: toprim domain-containing protein, partial [Alphaproteobacteria bacterium]|nr:toprim domain-containing protein [Alphaproteobacteria bacterium]
IEKYKNSSSSGIDKRRIFDLLEDATRFYQVQLKNSNSALDYVIKKRGFDKKTILEWRIGYSPNTGDALTKFLRSKGYTENELKLAGVVTTRYKGTEDMFKGRVMIPLCDASGRVIGYTARQLEEDDKSPKYINTPQTVLYDKSRHIFGLHLAKESIRKNGFAVLVEGNLDVITAHQYGFKQVVATAGTALTVYHLKAISRFTPDIRLCFDADKAGVNATQRAIELASKENIDLNIIDVKEGKDPDELIRKNIKLWEQSINTPVYALDWLIEYYKSHSFLSVLYVYRY